MGSHKATTLDVITGGYYQPSMLARFGMGTFLAFSAFAMPYSMVSISVASAQESSVINVVPDVVPAEPDATEEPVNGELPGKLLFSADAEIPETANIVIAQPTESEWETISWSPSEASYSFRNCTAEASLFDQELDSTGREASEEVILGLFPESDPTNQELVQVTEVRYNVISTAQYFGFGYQTRDGRFSWVYVRGFSTIDKASFISVDCPTQEEMQEASDSVRSQLGILISP